MKKQTTTWRKTVLASALTLALLPMAGQARVIPNVISAESNTPSNYYIKLKANNAVDINFNLDLRQRFGGVPGSTPGVFDQVGDSCNEFWDNGIDKIEVITEITNVKSCPAGGCQLSLTNPKGTVIGKVPDGNGGFTTQIPNGYVGNVHFDVTQLLADTGPGSLNPALTVKLVTDMGGPAAITLKLRDEITNQVTSKIVVDNTPLADTEEELGLDNKKVTVQIDADGLGNAPSSAQINISTIQVKNSDPSTPNFLLISGVPGSKYMYRNMIPELAKVGSVYAYDRPGLGESDKITDTNTYNYSLQSEAKLIDRLVKKLGIDKNLIIIANENGTLGAEIYVRENYKKNDPSNFIKGLVLTEPWVDACKPENTVSWDSDFTDPKNGPRFYFKTVDSPSGPQLDYSNGGKPTILENPQGQGYCTRGFTTDFFGDQFGGVYGYDAFLRAKANLPDPNDPVAVRGLAHQFSILSTWSGSFHNSPYKDFHPEGSHVGCVIFTGAFGVYLNVPFLNGGSNFGGLTLLTQNNNDNNTVLKNTLKDIILNPAQQALGISRLPDTFPGVGGRPPSVVGASCDPTDPSFNPFNCFPFDNELVTYSCFVNGDRTQPTVNPLSAYPRTIPFAANPDLGCENNVIGFGCPVPDSNAELALNNQASMAAGDPSGVLYGLPRLMLLGDTPAGGGTFIWHPSQVDYARNTLNWDARCVGRGGHILPDDAPLNMVKRILQWGHEKNLF